MTLYLFRAIVSRRLLRFLCPCLILISGRYGCAEVKIDLDEQQRMKVAWDGNTVVLPSKPGLQGSGGESRTVYNPVTRQYDKIDEVQGGSLLVYNKKRQAVSLGKPKRSAEIKDGVVIYREEFPAVGTWWEAKIFPVGDNGFEVALNIETAPEYWLAKFEIDLFNLNLPDAKGDSGDIRGAYRKRNPVTGEIPVPVKETIRINYPDGPGMFVPAAVLQNSELAMGVCLVGVHEVWRQTYGELELKPDPKNKAYKATIQSGWANINSFENFYSQKFSKRYRFRFSKPKPVGDAGYLRLVDAKELWKDYMEELQKQVPEAPTPSYDKTKNNIIITNFMLASPQYRTAENPQGYTMNRKDWVDDIWEWGKIDPVMNNEEIKKITGGLGAENVGRPVKWIKAWAERNVRELKETNALATIVFKTSYDEGNDPTTGRGPQGDWVPDTQLFHPDMEEQVPVEGAVRHWDWVTANIRVQDPAGKCVLEKKNVLIHAADKSQMIQIARHIDCRQVLSFQQEDMREGGVPYVEKANVWTAAKFRDHVVLCLTLEYPEKQLVGLKPGDSAELVASPQVNQPELAKTKLKVVAEITGVQRAAIDVWAKTIMDAGQEFGFLIREDFYLGTPWNHTFRTFDYAADWQYQFLKQRIQWNQIRFGSQCRWFYLDVFAEYTPQFVVEMLRSDFPDCFFFIEHPQDVTARQMQAWNWFGALTEIEKYVAPNALAGVLPSTILTGKDDRDREIMKKFWKNPNYVIFVHRDAKRVLRLAE